MAVEDGQHRRYSTSQYVSSRSIPRSTILINVHLPNIPPIRSPRRQGQPTPQVPAVEMSRGSARGGSNTPSWLVSSRIMRAAHSNFCDDKLTILTLKRMTRLKIFQKATISQDMRSQLGIGYQRTDHIELFSSTRVAFITSQAIYPGRY